MITIAHSHSESHAYARNNIKTEASAARLEILFRSSIGAHNNQGEIENDMDRIPGISRTHSLTNLLAAG